MESQKKISILIAEDHTLLREAWKFMLERDGRFEVTGQTGDVSELFQMTEDLKPDVIMLDININGENSIDLIPFIRARSVNSAILGVSLHSEPIFAKRMIENGSMGYVTKNASSQELIQAIIQVSQGKKFICEEILTKLSDQLLFDTSKDERIKNLSPREVEIVKQISNGFSSKEIGCILNITRKTVEVHRYNIMKKLNVPNAAGLVNYFNKHRLEFEEKLRPQLPVNIRDFKNGSSYFHSV